MLSTRKREWLARRSYQLHRDQLEKDFGNTLNAAHDHSVKSFHALLAGMVDHQDTALHGSWGWGSGTGWGKSTGLCAFFKAAHSLNMLGTLDGQWDHGNNLSGIVTAMRIESLYELEEQMTTGRFAIPAHRIMVLHSDTSGKFRKSDEGKDAPICLVAHNKLKYSTKHPTPADQEFLSYRGEVRDISIVDEAFNDAEATYVDADFLKDALWTLLGKAEGNPKASFLVNTLGPLLTAIKDEDARQEGLACLGRSEGMIQPPALSKDEHEELMKQVRSVRLMKDTQRLILTFISMLPSPIRLIRGKQSGVVSVINTMPAVLKNRIELNASFEIGMLSALAPTMKNADDHFPMLQDLKTQYGLEGLAGIIDYSDMTITHLQRGGGKSTMAGHLEDIRKQTDSTKEVLDFCIQAIKETPLDQAVLICTYLEDGVEYVDQLKKVFSRAGIDLKRTVVDYQGVEQPRINFTTYGQHLSTNRFRFCSVGIAVGVQQRHKAGLAGAMCGTKARSIAASVDFLEVDMVHQAMAAADTQQLIGRLQCRRVKDGKALPVKVYIVHKDDKDKTFRTRLMKAFPRATWKDTASENRLKRSQAYQVMLAVQRYVEANYHGQPLKTGDIKCAIEKGPETTRESYRLRSISERVWKDAIPLFLKNNPEWKRHGHSLIKAVDLHGFKDETVQGRTETAA